MGIGTHKTTFTLKPLPYTTTNHSSILYYIPMALNNTHITQLAFNALLQLSR